MSDKSITTYTSRLSVHITPAMSERLDQIAMIRDTAKAEIVREALRAYLDNQEDLIGSRKHFTKMFQRRVDYLEQLLAILVGMSVQSNQILLERIRKQQIGLEEVMQQAVYEGFHAKDTLYALIQHLAQDTRNKPPN